MTVSVLSAVFPLQIWFHCLSRCLGCVCIFMYTLSFLINDGDYLSNLNEPISAHIALTPGCQWLARRYWLIWIRQVITIIYKKICIQYILKHFFTGNRDTNTHTVAGLVNGVLHFWNALIELQKKIIRYTNRAEYQWWSCDTMRITIQGSRYDAYHDTGFTIRCVSRYRVHDTMRITIQGSRYDAYHDTGFTIHDTILSDWVGAKAEYQWWSCNTICITIQNSQYDTVRLGRCNCTSELGILFWHKNKHTLLTTEYIVSNTGSHHSDAVLHHTHAKDWQSSQWHSIVPKLKALLNRVFILILKVYNIKQKGYNS